MSIGDETLRWSAALWLAGAALAPVATAQTDVQAAPAAERYVRAVRGGAPVRNLPDPDGLELVRHPAGSVLAVFDERANWLEVEVPGGFPVWVYGRYLRPAGEEGVFEVTGNGINLRPRPNRNVTNYPLSGRLHAGDRVRAVGTAPQEVEDADGEPKWVRVWSPPGVRGWVSAAETEALEAGAVGTEVWNAALESLAPEPERVAPRPDPSERPAERSNAPEGSSEEGSRTAAPAARSEPDATQTEAQAALVRARDLLEEQRRAEQPNFAEVREAFARVVEIAPSGVAARLARQGLETVDALEAAASIRAELQAERERHEQQLLDRQEEIWERSRKKDPHFARFDGRGVLERRVVAGDLPRFWLRWGGEDLFEVTCRSGRYDLDVFAGYEIGILGSPEAGLLDASRVVVLSRREPPAATLAVSWLRRFFAWLGRVSGTSAPLCDTCKYDYGNVCTRPERPNARRCPDYKRK